LESPLCDAVIAHVPVPAVMVTLPFDPLYEHGPVTPTATARPELAVGLIANDEPYAAGLAGCANVIVCEPLLTVCVSEPELASKFAEPL
jgi:hypothetical protein